MRFSCLDAATTDGSKAASGDDLDIAASAARRQRGRFQL
jgi:hypothetical protein